MLVIDRYMYLFWILVGTLFSRGYCLSLLINPDFMIVLKEKFRPNGLPYTLLKRNERVALYSIGGTLIDKILLYEVCKIYIHQDKYEIRESTTNE